MIRDTRDEGWKWRWQLSNESYDCFLEYFLPHMTKEQATKVLHMYGITPDIPREDACIRFEQICADAAFKLPNVYSVHHSNKPCTFGYNLDQESTFDNVAKGIVYHAIDLYVFLTLTHEMPPEQLSLAYRIAGHWIDFACGKDTCERFGEKKRWMVYGPIGQAALKTETKDEEVRGYERMKAIESMGLSYQFLEAFEESSMKKKNSSWGQRYGALGTTKALEKSVWFIIR